MEEEGGARGGTGDGGEKGEVRIDEWGRKQMGKGIQGIKEGRERRKDVKNRGRRKGGNVSVMTKKFSLDVLI